MDTKEAFHPQSSQWGAMVCPIALIEPDEVPMSMSTTSVTAGKRNSDRLTIRQRRQMGLTFRGVASAAETIKQSDPQAWSDMDNNERAEAIAEELASQNVGAYENAGANWDAILAFITQMLPLIIAIFGL